MNFKIVFGLMMIFLTLPGVQGLTWVESCLDSDTMYKEAVLEIDGVQYLMNQTIECEYNCSSDFQKCNPPSKEKADDSVLIAIIVGLAVITAMFFYLAINLTISHDSDTGPIEHYHLQPMFFLFGMVFITVMFFVMGIYTDSSSQLGLHELMWSLYTVSLFIDMFIAIYVIIMFLKTLGDWLSARTKNRKERGM